MYKVPAVQSPRQEGEKINTGVAVAAPPPAGAQVAKGPSPGQPLPSGATGRAAQRNETRRDVASERRHGDIIKLQYILLLNRIGDEGGVGVCTHSLLKCSLPSRPPSPRQLGALVVAAPGCRRAQGHGHASSAAAAGRPPQRRRLQRVPPHGHSGPALPRRLLLDVGSREWRLPISRPESAAREACFGMQ